MNVLMYDLLQEPAVGFRDNKTMYNVMSLFVLHCM